MDNPHFTGTPAFWVVLLVLGVPGLYALVLSLLRKPTYPSTPPADPGSWESKKALLQEEMALEEKTREDRKALEEGQERKKAEVEERVKEEQIPAQSPEKVVEYLDDIGKKVRK